MMGDHELRLAAEDCDAAGMSGEDWEIVTGSYPVLAVDDDWVVIDMDMPIAFHRNLVAEFLSAKSPVD